ncbi:MAG: hypothetical protein V1827_03955 [Candidatus Micrarchaeota archaeon]
MNQLRFDTLSQNKREKMMAVVRRWQKSGESIRLLEESLRTLSKHGRKPAYELLREESRLKEVDFMPKPMEISNLAVTYGKGPRPKLTLDKKEAGQLLELVQMVKEATEGASKGVVIDTVVQVALAVLEGREPVLPRFKDLKAKVSALLDSLVPRQKSYGAERQQELSL